MSVRVFLLKLVEGSSSSSCQKYLNIIHSIVNLFFHFVFTGFMATGYISKFVPSTDHSTDIVYP